MAINSEVLQVRDTNLDVMVVTVLPAQLDFDLLDIVLVHLVSKEVTTPCAGRIHADVIIHPGSRPLTRTLLHHQVHDEVSRIS